MTPTSLLWTAYKKSETGENPLICCRQQSRWIVHPIEYVHGCVLLCFRCVTTSWVSIGYIPDSKVHGANMGPIWGRQDPGGPHVGPMSFAIWDAFRLLMTRSCSLQFYDCPGDSEVSLKDMVELCDTSPQQNTTYRKLTAQFLRSM